MDLLLPVAPDNVGNRDYMSSELSDFGIIGFAIAISTVHSLQAYIRFTSGFAAAILDSLLPVTSDNGGSRDSMSSELSDLVITGVSIGISTIRSLEDEIHEPALKVDRYIVDWIDLG